MRRPIDLAAGDTLRDLGGRQAAEGRSGVACSCDHVNFYLRFNSGSGMRTTMSSPWGSSPKPRPPSSLPLGPTL